MQKRGSVRQIVPFEQTEQGSAGSLQVTETGQGGTRQGFTCFSQTVPSGQVSHGSAVTKVTFHKGNIVSQK